MASIDLRRIGGALAQFWAGGRGPTRAQIQSALLIAGYEGADEGNKQELVLRSIVESGDRTARGIIEELLSLLRESGYFELGGREEQINRFTRAVTDAGHQLDAQGFISWDDPDRDPRTWLPSSPPASREPPEPTPELTAPLEVASPNIDLLVSSLRRLGAGATRPIVHRRRQDRPALRFADEYDVQDVVELLLRSLYSDVRHEEPTPSSAGSSSRIDLHLREGRTAVEVKVTAKGRAEKHIKPEVLVDINDYQTHPKVDTLVVAIYDLAGTFENPAGFEHDLSGLRNGLEVRVIVVPWVGPRSPND